MQRRNDFSSGRRRTSSVEEEEDTFVNSAPDDKKNYSPRLIRPSHWLYDSSPSRRRMERSTTLDELELFATTRTVSEQHHHDVLVLPSQGHMDDESSTDSSLSSAAHSSSSSSNQGDIVLIENTDEPKKSPRFRIIRFAKKRRQLMKEVDVEQYMASREMTPLQEQWNALTMIPAPLICLYYILSAQWVNETLVEQARSSGSSMEWETVGNFGGFVNDMVGDEHGCLPQNSWLTRSMPALPPLPVLAIAFGIVAHAPFSFLYHWRYARILPAGTPRTYHWSRRMDHAMIHMASACISYGTSGSWDYFVANLLYNGDCIYRQFKPKVRPRRNKIRVIISVLAYTIPILKRGDLALFLQLWLVLGISFWLFGAYPIGGWSHAAFHLMIALAPPLIMGGACHLPASQDQMQLAAQCMALRQ